MNLFELTHARQNCAGGGTRKYLTKTSKRRTNVVLLMKGGVKLDNALTRDRL